MSQEQVIWILMFVASYILGIMQIYACYRFKSLQSLLIIQKRFPTLVVTEAVVVIFWLIIGFPLWTNSIFHGVTFGLTGNSLDNLHRFWYMSPPTIHFLMHIEVARLWLISFNLHYLNSSRNEQWKSQIDKSFADKNWYLRNRNKYGNTKYVVSRVFVYYICVATFVLTMYIYFINIAFFLDGIVYIIAVGTVVYIYYDCRNYKELKDNLFFHYEFRATATIWLVALSVYCFSIVLFVIVGFNHISAALIVLCPFAALTAPSLLSTLWIPKKILANKVWTNDYRNNMLKKEKIHKLSSVSDAEMDSDAGAEKNTVQSKLFATLKSNETFEPFIEWMFREFCDESILCFIELVQWKEFLVENANQLQNQNSHWMNVLFDGFLKSSIVYGGVTVTEEVKTYQHIAHSLYDKYIKYDAEFEVNIAAHLRLKYIEYDDDNWNMEIDELFNVFDDVIQEMWMFMVQSFVRYIT